MSIRRIAFVSLLLVPTVLTAQRGRTRGDKEANWDEIGKVTTTGLKLSNRDVEDISPVKLLIEKRKDLKLADDQLAKIKELESKMKEKNDPFFKTMDSLRAVMKRPSGKLSDEEQVQVTLARQEVMRVLGDIRGVYETTFKDAVTLLNADQQKTAAELVEKQNNEAQEMLHDKLGGGGGGAGMGGGNRRGRPPVA